MFAGYFQVLTVFTCSERLEESNRKSLVSSDLNGSIPPARSPEDIVGSSILLVSFSAPSTQLLLVPLGTG